MTFKKNLPFLLREKFLKKSGRKEEGGKSGGDKKKAGMKRSVVPNPRKEGEQYLQHWKNRGKKKRPTYYRFWGGENFKTEPVKNRRRDARNCHVSRGDRGEVRNGTQPHQKGSKIG